MQQKKSLHIAFSKIIPIIFGLILLVGACYLHVTTNKPVRLALQRLDNIAYDLQLRFAFSKQAKLNTPIVIVDIDDKSLKEQGRWPWTRDKLAQLIVRMHQLGAVVIAFDMAFPEVEENAVAIILSKLPQLPHAALQIKGVLQQLAPYFDYDKVFERSLQQGDVVLGMTFHNNNSASQGMSPIPMLELNPELAQHSSLIATASFTNNLPLLDKAAKHSGFINVLADEDGIIRRVPLVLQYQDGVYPSLALAATKLFLLDDVKLEFKTQADNQILDGIRLGNTYISTDSKGQVLIPFLGPVKSFPYISATDILNGRTSGQAFAGKLVFVGTSAFGLGDLQTTAIQNAYPGVEIHASIANGIIHGLFPYRPNWMRGAEFIFTFLLGVTLALVFPFLTPWALTISVTIIPTAMFLIRYWVFTKTHLVFSLTVTIILLLALAILNMGYGYLFENRRREELKNMFGEYVPPAYIELILHNPKDIGHYSETREMTVLFADIRNFTTLSEQMNAAAIKEMLNLFFTPMTQIIFDNGGTIDKYVGDMIMAFWGAPLPNARHRQLAIEAALAMQEKVKQLKQIFKQKGLPEINIGIGINTGLMSVGDMGSEFRRAYTVIGDAVNLASRLESLTKYYGVGVIVGHETQSGLTDYLFRKLDYVKVKGKEISVDIYEPLGLRSVASETLLKEVEEFGQALTYYVAQQWELALSAFNQLITVYPGTMLYKYYLEQISLALERHSK